MILVGIFSAEKLCARVKKIPYIKTTKLNNQGDLFNIFKSTTRFLAFSFEPFSS